MPSFIGEILEQGMSDKDRDSLKYAAATMYAAGADTVCEKRIIRCRFLSERNGCFIRQSLPWQLSS